LDNKGRVLKTLPVDGFQGALIGRVWRPDVEGPSVVVLRAEGAFDISDSFPTVRDLCEEPNPAVVVRHIVGTRIGDTLAILGETFASERSQLKPWFVAPIDLQAIKAAGVTFATSMLERVIEERTRGNAGGAAEARAAVMALVGDDLSKLRPGSPEAKRLKDWLIEQNAWSQYLEVGIGPDAEIFTKAQPMSAVGTGAVAGLHPNST